MVWCTWLQAYYTTTSLEPEAADTGAGPGRNQIHCHAGPACEVRRDRLPKPCSADMQAKDEGGEVLQMGGAETRGRGEGGRGSDQEQLWCVHVYSLVFTKP